MSNRRISRAVAAATLASTLALVSVAAAATAAPAAQPAGTVRLQAALDDLVAAGAPGAIALVRDGDRVLRLRSGLGTLRPRTRIRVTDRFRAGSVTKTFVATVVLQLVQEHGSGSTTRSTSGYPGSCRTGSGSSCDNC